jgi:hypothetical protein
LRLTLNRGWDDDNSHIITLQHTPHTTAHWGQCTTAIFLVSSWCM